MELTRLEGEALNFDLNLNLSKPVAIGEHTSASPVPPKAKQPNLEKTKAEPEKQAVSESEGLNAMEKANELMELFSCDLRFEKHQDTGIIQISIVDRNDGNVIKKIPPNSVLDVIARMRDIIGGLMDVKA